MDITLVKKKQLLKTAIKLAESAHRGQVDKGGNTYINHPKRVMDNVKELDEKIVAVLHDTIEDTNLVTTILEETGFPPHIVEALVAITKNKGESYEDYIQRVIKNPLALVVKIADMEDNMNMSRIPNPTERDIERLAKYERFLPILKEALNVSRVSS